MSSAIVELQKQAVEANGDINSLLRKAHLIAYKLGLTEFDNWITNELNGYSSSESLPKYRRMRANVQINVRGQYPIPVAFDEGMAELFLLDRGITDSISHLTSVLERSETNHVEIAMPGPFCETICHSHGLPVMPCVWTYPTTVLQLIIEAVRKEVLDWALELEREGIRGEDMDFTDKEKQLAQTTTNINVSGTANIISGDANGSTVFTTVNRNHDIPIQSVLDAVTELRANILNELKDPEELQQAESMLDKVETAAKQENPAKAKKWLGILMNFLSGVGTGITARMVGDLIGKLFSGQ